MKALVTGGTGFIGSHLAKTLLDEGHEVTVVGSKTERPIPDGVKFLQLHLDGINWSAVAGHDVVFHKSANNDTLDSNIEEMRKANVTAPIRLFRAAMGGGCRKFIYASSTAVYGDSPAPYKEDSTPLNPLNEYAKSKLEFDEFAMKFAEDYDVQVVGLRYCNVFGPGEDHKRKRASMIHQLVKTMSSGLRPKLFTPGDQKRDWVYVKDVVRANIMAAQSNCSGIFNVGSGKAVTFNYLVDIINGHLFRKLEPEYIDCPFKDKYQSHTECDITKAKDDFGWEPEYFADHGIVELMT